MNRRFSSDCPSFMSNDCSIVLVCCARTRERNAPYIRGREIMEIPRIGLSRCKTSRWCEELLPGGAAGNRTPDLRRAKAALSRLSYGPPFEATPGWARLDSNQGPRPYQGRALTT